MTREENLHWIDEEIRTWENECQSKHPIKEALHAARKALEQKPCEDAVSFASVFEIMGNLMSIPYDFDRSITEKDVSERMDKIRVLPRVTPQAPRWIPVTERLPKEEPNTYWVCTNNGCQRECRWTNVNPFWSYETTDWHWNIADIPQYTEVVAWMPLPEPYKEDKE